jgi:hypothetical protein
MLGEQFAALTGQSLGKSVLAGFAKLGHGWEPFAAGLDANAGPANLSNNRLGIPAQNGDRVDKVDLGVVNFGVTIGA